MNRPWIQVQVFVNGRETPGFPDNSREETAEDCPGATIPQGPDPECPPKPDLPPEADPDDLAGAADMAALTALQHLSVDHPGRIVGSWRPERILAVCRAAESRKDRLKNVAGWITQALRQNWDV